jgi:hypothetical protein
MVSQYPSSFGNITDKIFFRAFSDKSDISLVPETFYSIFGFRIEFSLKEPIKFIRVKTPTPAQTTICV